MLRNLDAEVKQMRFFQWLNSQKNSKQMKFVLGVGLILTITLMIFGILDQALIVFCITLVFFHLLKKEQVEEKTQK